MITFGGTPGATSLDVAPGGASTATASIDVVGDEAVSLRERKKLRTWAALHDAARELLLEQGVDGVTIEEICARADVSPRTFFNYFPSKAAAALGLHEARVTPEALARFAERSGRDRLLDDLCDLMASTVHLSPDRTRTKELVERRPELAPAMHRWMSDLRLAAMDAAAERVDPDTARLAVTVTTAALMEAVHGTPPESADDLAARLKQIVAAMRELLA